MTVIDFQKYKLAREIKMLEIELKVVDRNVSELKQLYARWASLTKGSRNGNYCSEIVA